MVKSYRLTECVFWKATAPVGPRAYRFEVSRPHKIRHKQSVGLLYTRVQFVAAVVTSTTFKKHRRRASAPSVRIEPTISASKRAQTYALDIATTEMGLDSYSYHKYLSFKNPNLDIYFSTSILSPNFADGLTFVFRAFLTFELVGV